MLHEGDTVQVKIIAIDEKSGKLKLSRKALLPKPEGYVEEERPRAPRRDGGNAPRRDGGHGDDRRSGRNDRGERRR